MSKVGGVKKGGYLSIYSGCCSKEEHNLWGGRGGFKKREQKKRNISLGNKGPQANPLKGKRPAPKGGGAPELERKGGLFLNFGKRKKVRRGWKDF